MRGVMRVLGSSIGTSRFTLHSPLPGRLNYVDYKRTASLLAFYWVWSVREHPQKMKEGRRMQFWRLSSGTLPVESLPTKAWTPTRQQFTQPCLSKGEEPLPTLAFSGLGEVRSPTVPALGICIIPCASPSSCLHLCIVSLLKSHLIVSLENPSYSCWESNNAEGKENLLAPHNSCHVPFLGQTDPAGSHQWHRQSSPVSCLIQGYTPEAIASFTCPEPSALG